LALCLAHQYCVRHGLKNLDMQKVMAVCEQSLPVSIYGDDKKKQWCQMVLTTLRALAVSILFMGWRFTTTPSSNLHIYLQFGSVFSFSLALRAFCFLFKANGNTFLSHFLLFYGWYSHSSELNRAQLEKELALNFLSSFALHSQSCGFVLALSLRLSQFAKHIIWVIQSKRFKVFSALTQIPDD